jgi:hypothetical protein
VKEIGVLRATTDRRKEDLPHTTALNVQVESIEQWKLVHPS